MSQRWNKLFIALVVIACSDTPNLKMVDKEQYSSDVTCWGGHSGRYFGVVVFGGDGVKVPYLFSNRCSVKVNNPKFSVFDNWAIIKLYDPLFKLETSLNTGKKVVDNTEIPLPMPDTKEKLYVVDFKMTLNSFNGVDFFKIDRVNSMHVTDKTYENLIENYEKTMKETRQLENEFRISRS